MISVKNVNKIIDCFPTALFAEEELLSVDENKIITNKIYKLQETFGAGNTQAWLSGKNSPDNCFQYGSLLEYLEFRTLVERAQEAVKEFALAYGSEEDYYCQDAWYNIYQSNKYQEFHVHPNVIFSAIYFVKVPDGSQPVYFKKPDMSHVMLPPKNKKFDTPYNQEFIMAPPQERTLIIFRSNLQHSVPPAILEDDRITIALNFA